MTQALSSEKHLPELLTVTEVAAYLGVPISTIHFWRGRKQGPPAFKVGRRLMFRADAVAAWLDERAASSGDGKGVRDEMNERRATGDANQAENAGDPVP